MNGLRKCEETTRKRHKNGTRHELQQRKKYFLAAKKKETTGKSGNKTIDPTRKSTSRKSCEKNRHTCINSLTENRRRSKKKRKLACRLEARGGAAQGTSPSQWQMAFLSSVVHKTGCAEAETVPHSASRLFFGIGHLGRQKKQKQRFQIAQKRQQ